MIRIESGLLPSDLPRFREIFFLTSHRKNFASATDRDQFFERWTGYYLRSEPESIFVARDEAGTLVGYLTGCKDTRLAPGQMNSMWEDLYVRFPAHFHINCHPENQGLGIGSRLLERFTQALKEEGLGGVFLVTDPEAENKRFYSKNGFNFELIRPWKDRRLLFMGRDLSTQSERSLTE